MISSNLITEIVSISFLHFFRLFKFTLINVLKYPFAIFFEETDIKKHKLLTMSH